MRPIPLALAVQAVFAFAATAQESIEQKVAAMLQKIDAAALRQSNEDLVGFETRNIYSRTDSSTVGTGAARTYMFDKLKALEALSGGRLTVTREEYAVDGRSGPATAVNIVATLTGTTDPDRIYIVGGHYDSRNSNGGDGENLAPGANDDGSGTVLVMEACRVMCETPFAATIKFVCYDGEEQGLLGSGAHAEALSAAGANVDGMITNDIVGNTLGMDGVVRRTYIRAFSYAETGNDSTGRSLARAISFAGKRHVSDFEVMLIYRGDRFGRGGDHRSFFNAGYPGVRMTEPREDYSRQHQNVTERDGQPYGDLPGWVDFDYLARVTAVNVAALAELASAPAAPASVNARGSRQSYDTNLTWSPIEGVDDYELVWRLTTSADWEGAQLLEDVEARAPQARRGGGRGRGNAATPVMAATLVGVPIDDMVVGVRAVAADGSRSRVTTPRER
jgi:Zn-dependent M28 family amino/carboxypeptidase